jgi:hypothetical protein
MCTIKGTGRTCTGDFCLRRTVVGAILGSSLPPWPGTGEWSSGVLLLSLGGSSGFLSLGSAFNVSLACRVGVD